MNPKLGQFSKKTVLFIILAELLSLFSFLLPSFMPYTFWTIVALFFIISLYKLEWGLYILLAELFIGSKGYLFFFEHSGLAVSTRIAFFTIFLSIWLAQKLIKPKLTLTWLKEIHIKYKPLVTSYELLVTIIAWGFVCGLIQGHTYDNVFFDFNGWLYFLLFLPFLELINLERIKKIITLLITCATWTTLKTFAALYVFSHQFFNVRPFYKWLRDSGVGEITVMDGGFSRIFFQSQIYVLIALFILATIIVYKIIRKEKIHLLFSIIHLLLFATLITSLSRSFWVGLLAGLGLLFLHLIFKDKTNFKNILKLSGGLLATLAISAALIFVVVKIPPTTADIYGSMFEQRITQFTTEAAGSSRISQLKPLFKKIVKHPVIGSGFGTTITYKSQDPRIITPTNPDGWYTTYAFEWSYLDILLKLGLVGLTIYLYFIFLILKIGYQQLSINNKQSSSILTLGLLLGLAALLITNIFSPYINHPLGIGYVLLCGAIFVSLKSQVDHSREWSQR